MDAGNTNQLMLDELFVPGRSALVISIIEGVLVKKLVVVMVEMRKEKPKAQAAAATVAEFETLKTRVLKADLEGVPTVLTASADMAAVYDRARQVWVDKAPVRVNPAALTFDHSGPAVSMHLEAKRVAKEWTKDWADLLCRELHGVNLAEYERERRTVDDKATLAAGLAKTTSKTARTDALAVFLAQKAVFGANNLAGAMLGHLEKIPGSGQAKLPAQHAWRRMTAGMSEADLLMRVQESAADLALTADKEAAEKKEKKAAEKAAAAVVAAAEKKVAAAAEKKWGKAGGGGGSSGGGRGGGDRECFNCHKMGHIALRCPGIECYRCHEKGHMASICTNGRAERKYCHVCNTDAHRLHDCPMATCCKCEKKGHWPSKCPSDSGADKESASKYVTGRGGEREAAPAAATAAGTLAMVKGTVDGQPAVVGLDSFASTVLVAERAVETREVEESGVTLMGVSGAPTDVLGEVDVDVCVGETCVCERAVVLEKLPAEVDVLVGHDALHKMGMQLKDGVTTIGGERCETAKPAHKGRTAAAVEGRKRYRARRKKKKRKRKQIERNVARLRAEREEVEAIMRKQEEEAAVAIKGRTEQFRAHGLRELGMWTGRAESRVVAAAVAAPTLAQVRELAKHGAEEVTDEDVRVVLGEDPPMPETVPLDDYCEPEVDSAAREEEYRAAVEEHVRSSNYEHKEARERLRTLLLTNRDCYCIKLEAVDVGQLKMRPPLVLHLDQKEGAPPMVAPQRHMGAEDNNFMVEQTEEFDRLGIWGPPTEEMNAQGVSVSNVVVVKKTDPATGDVKRRLTVDYLINQVIKAPPQVNPRVDMLADRIGQSDLFDKEDAISGYYQRMLAEESRRHTGVYTPLGVRVFHVMPLGINVAPAEWNGAMAEAFGDMDQGRVFQLMDDLVRGTTRRKGESRLELEMRHLDLHENCLERVRKGGMLLKLSKSAFGREKIEALGACYEKGKVSMSDKAVLAVKNYPMPAGPKQLNRFLALAQYYANYEEDFARRVDELRGLARKTRWERGVMGEGSPAWRTVVELKERLARQVQLAAPDWSKPFVTKSDFSKDGLGAALLQEVDGKLQPIGFASRKCSSTEQRLGAPEGEVLALTFAFKKFERYLAASRFKATAYTDQGSLVFLKTKELGGMGQKRMQSAFAYLRQFRFALRYKKGAAMAEVDALSRAPVEDEVVAAVAARGARWAMRLAEAVEGGEGTLLAVAAAAAKQGPLGTALIDKGEAWGFDTSMRSWREDAEEDDEIRAVRELIGGRKLAELQVPSGPRDRLKNYLSGDKECEELVIGADERVYRLTMKDGEVRRLLYAPLTWRARLVVARHAVGHRAAAEVQAMIERAYWWPGMRRDIEDFVDGCSCRRKKDEGARRVGEMQALELSRPGQKIVFDIFGPLTPSLEGNVYILVMVDVGTRELMLKRLKKKSAVLVAKALFDRVFLKGMCPEEFQSDLAKEFLAEVTREVVTLLGAKFKHSSPYHPQTNTHAERYMRTIATNLSLLIEREDQRDWDQHLKMVEYAQLVGAQQVKGRLSTLFLKGGWHAVDVVDVHAGVQVKSQTVAEWASRLERGREIAMQAQQSSAARNAKRWVLERKDKDGNVVGKGNVKELDVDVGDKCWVMFPNVGRGKSRKLACKLHGPYELKRWRHGERRAAVLGHCSDMDDEILAHVDRIVKVKSVSPELTKLWGLKRLGAAGEEDEEEQGGGEAEAEGEVEAEEERVEAEVEEEVVPLEEMLEQMDPETRLDVEQNVENKEYDVEKIVDEYDSIDGKRYYLVRGVGYSADEDWTIEVSRLRKTAPQAVMVWIAKQEELELEELEQRKKAKAKKKQKSKKGGGKKRKG